MGLRPCVVFGCVATEASNSGFRIRRNWDRVHSNVWSVHCPSAVCQSPRCSNFIVGGFLVPSALRFQSSDFASSGHTICIPNQTLCTVRSPNQMPNLQLGFILLIGSVEIYLLALPTLSHTKRQILVSVSCHTVFRIAFCRHDLFDIWT